MIALEAHPRGTILPVKAHAGARRNAVGGEQAGKLRVSVTQAPEKGKANQAILTLLAASLGLRKNQIELVSGETSAQKRFLVQAVSPADLMRRLQQLE